MHTGRLIAMGETAPTLTSALVSETFDVEATVQGAGSSQAIVDVA
jgi:ABC-type hemin transport system ATPase subunit